MAAPVIQVRSVSKDFLLPHLRHNTLKSRFVHLFRGRNVVEVQHTLRDIDFDVARGEFFGVIGRNGCGKSTLLKILSGIYQPTKGTVAVQGRLVPFIELGVGFNPELTGRENVYLNGALLGFSQPEVDEMYDDIVSFAELEDSMDQKLKNYSSGMQVRIAFSVATRAKADVLLIDEVLAVGDASFKRKCFDHFRALKKAGTTIVFVTHDMNLVREFCDRAILIEDTRVIAEGHANDAANQYAKLFEPVVREDQRTTPDPAAGHRWGEGDMRYESVLVPEQLNGQGQLVLTMRAIAERDVGEAVYGFVISDAAGKPILGTTSMNKKRLCGSLARGDRVQVEWTVPNVFSRGLHRVDVTITDRQGLAVYDSWSEAASFTVLKEESSPYPVTPDTGFCFARLEE